MTIEEKLTVLRNMGGYSDTNDVLSTYLNLAGDKIIATAFPYRSDVTEVPEKYLFLHLEYAMYMLNRRGAEGQTSHSENGISRSYENADMPASMLRRITPEVGTL